MLSIRGSVEYTKKENFMRNDEHRNKRTEKKINMIVTRNIEEVAHSQCFVAEISQIRVFAIFKVSTIAIMLIRIFLIAP